MYKRIPKSLEDIKRLRRKLRESHAFRAATKGIKKLQKLENRGMVTARKVVARCCRTHPRTRARRSPASVRRATADSGGSDSDGGDPEPPRRPRSTSFSAVLGGAL